ncbi:MAG: PAS domain-containing protein [Bacteroidales bacterium]|jgi:DUF438 domain-containing protein|nr:PAS domain-containing protein [Bacteroidales bacterium]
MSEFTKHAEERKKQLIELYDAIIEKRNAVQAIKQSETLLKNIVPSDIIMVVDTLVDRAIPMQDLKLGINKFLNVVYQAVKDYPYTPPKENTFLHCCIKNNEKLDELLTSSKPMIKKINESPGNKGLQTGLTMLFREVSRFINYYIIKENVLFPIVEKHLKEYKCLQVMWSFHDDIKSNIKALLANLESDSFDIDDFNFVVGDIFFDMYAIKFREERILYPLIEEIVPEEELNKLFAASAEIGFPYYTPENIDIDDTDSVTTDQGDINLKTGSLSAEQIILLFNHLPVDITFVDENNKVKYFSTPPKRIFPRTTSIIGRDVNNCHPPESVHVVEQIVEAFRDGTKDKASFWIKMMGDYILIQYFAIRDEEGNYRGVVEVSQEISEIKSLEGEQRLLDWEK